MAKKKNKGGRPTVMTAETVQKLELGFLKGLNDLECCHFAGISRQTLYKYCREHPEFTDRKEELKQHPSVQAKLNVVEAIENGDADLSKWWLERRNKEEFSLKQEVGVSGTVSNPFVGLTTEELKKLVYDE